MHFQNNLLTEKPEESEFDEEVFLSGHRTDSSVESTKNRSWRKWLRTHFWYGDPDNSPVPLTCEHVDPRNTSQNSENPQIATKSNGMLKI